VVALVPGVGQLGVQLAHLGRDPGQNAESLLADFDDPRAVALRNKITVLLRREPS
jgi:hypothetical protein